MINHSEITLVDLHSFKTIKKIMEDQAFDNSTKTIKEIVEEQAFDDESMKSNGIALLFTDKPASEYSIQIDLFQFANTQLANTINGLENISEFAKNGKIDPDLKHFTYQMLLVNQWLFNCHSIRKGELKEFPVFDKIDLKDQLTRLIQLL